jgi:hypothetical protein
MCSWLSNPEVFWDNEEMDVLDNYKKMAEHAYIAADAFLAQGAPGVDGKETNVVGTRRKEKGRTL